jgi:uncharacterized protein (TIGR02757 family)
MPDAEKNSAFKRFNLFLRWMIRKDAVDPGLWAEADKSRLLYPMDVHMFKIAGCLDIGCRKTGDMKTAVEVTDFFRKFAFDDPVRYDFCMTRMGLHPDVGYAALEGLK